ncbi:MAG: GGDEF domain-containing protein [Desulfohalobiaceae bacterium]
MARLFRPVLWTMGLSMSVLLLLLSVGAYLFRWRLLHHVVNPLVQFTRNVIALKQGRNSTEVFITDITERKQYQQRLNYLSSHEALTGFYNRNFFEEEMRRLQNVGYHPLGIIVCDLSGLKLINDTLGHESGDEMLVRTVSLIRENFRSSDIVARIGGDARCCSPASRSGRSGSWSPQSGMR